MKITNIERIGVNMQYDERVAEHLYKSSLANRATDEEFAAHNERFHREQRERPMPSVTTAVYLVHTDEGLTGLGEGESISNDELAPYVGHSPFEYIMDDSVGPLQIAFYDLMGQALGLPIARLLGPSRATAPLAWWSHCFSPAALQVEAKLALARGFRVHKIKRRAHTDVVEQVAAIAEVTPDDYEVTVDANRTFGNVERALAIGAQLKRFPQVHCLSHRSIRTISTAIAESRLSSGCTWRTTSASPIRSTRCTRGCTTTLSSGPGSLPWFATPISLMRGESSSGCSQRVPIYRPSSCCTWPPPAPTRRALTWRPASYTSSLYSESH